MQPRVQLRPSPPNTSMHCVEGSDATPNTDRPVDVPGDVIVDVDVEHGGRLAQITVAGTPFLIDPDPPRGAPLPATGWGSYPMAPWAGRVRDGRFTHFGVDHQLELNMDDSGRGTPGRSHAIHGTVFDAPWTIEEQTLSMVSMCRELGVAGTGWQLGGVAHQRIEVLDRQLRCDLSVSLDPHAVDHSPFPAVIGWHPWWRKPDRLTFHPDAMYERDGVGLPTGRLMPPSAGPWDDCFVNTAPVTLHYDRQVAADIIVSSDCDHWVVFDELAGATCVEPQSGPPDGFNLGPRLVTATHPIRHTMIVTW